MTQHMFRCEQITNVSKVFDLHIIERYINISIISILFSRVKDQLFCSHTLVVLKNFEATIAMCGHLLVHTINLE